MPRSAHLVILAVLLLSVTALFLVTGGKSGEPESLSDTASAAGSAAAEDQQEQGAERGVRNAAATDSTSASPGATEALVGGLGGMWVTARCEGEPVSGAKMVLLSMRGMTNTRSAEGEPGSTNAEGRVFLVGPPLGDGARWMLLAGSVPGLAPVASRLMVDPGIEAVTVEYVPVPARIRGVVLDPQGLPIAAGVALAVATPQRACWARVLGESGADGRFDFPWPEGMQARCVLCARVDGLPIAWQKLDGSEGISGAPLDVTLVMPQPARITVRVLDADSGKPRVGAGVRAWTLVRPFFSKAEARNWSTGGGLERAMTTAHVVTDEKGEGVLTCWAAGERVAIFAGGLEEKRYSVGDQVGAGLEQVENRVEVTAVDGLAVSVSGRKPEERILRATFEFRIPRTGREEAGLFRGGAGLLSDLKEEAGGLFSAEFTVDPSDLLDPEPFRLVIEDGKTNKIWTSEPLVITSSDNLGTFIVR